MRLDLHLGLELRLRRALGHEKRRRVEGKVEGGTDTGLPASVGCDDELDFSIILVEDDHLVDDAAETHLHSLGHNIKESKVLCKHRDGIARGVDELLVAVFEDDHPLLDL